MKYLAIGFWISDTGEDFRFGRETDSKDGMEIAKMLCEEAGMSLDNIALVLLLKSNKEEAPEVVKSWRAMDGDFSNDND